jgi:hypothetical protein
MLEDYGLPEDPKVSEGVNFFPLMSGLRKLGSTAMWAGLLGSALFFLRRGRRFPPPEEEAVAAAYAKGEASGRAAEAEGGGPERGPEGR